MDENGIKIHREIHVIARYRYHWMGAGQEEIHGVVELNSRQSLVGGEVLVSGQGKR